VNENSIRLPHINLGTTPTGSFLLFNLMLMILVSQYNCVLGKKTDGSFSLSDPWVI
jgi:hypothetical protein